MNIFDYRVKSNSMPAKCGIQIFHPHPEQTVVICSELEDNPGMSICNGFQDLITQVVQAYNLNLHELIWIEHWQGCPALMEPEHYALVEFDVISVPRRGGGSTDRAVNPRWSFMAEEKLRSIAQHG